MANIHVPDTVTDEETFNDALNTLLQTAHENGVDVERPWDCRNGPTHPDWDITIVEAKKPPGTAKPDPNRLLD